MNINQYVTLMNYQSRYFMYFSPHKNIHGILLSTAETWRALFLSWWPSKLFIISWEVLLDRLWNYRIGNYDFLAYIHQQWCFLCGQATVGTRRNSILLPLLNALCSAVLNVGPAPSDFRHSPCRPRMPCGCTHQNSVQPHTSRRGLHNKRQWFGSLMYRVTGVNLCQWTKSNSTSRSNVLTQRHWKPNTDLVEMLLKTGGNRQASVLVGKCQWLCYY